MSDFLRHETDKRNIPDLMDIGDGRKVENLADWEIRKKQIHELLSNYCYGVTPDLHPEVVGETLVETSDACCGKAVQMKVNITITMDWTAGATPSFSYRYITPYVWGDSIKSRETLTFPINIIIPKNINKPPMFLYASFSPMLSAGNVPVEEIIDQGYGIASFYYQDVIPDRKDDYEQGKVLYGDASIKNEWGALAKWAWAFSRVMDYLQTLDSIDANKIAVCGASRLGKAALWAGINDERFPLVVPMISGTGGASLYRQNEREQIDHLIKSFPHWFCRNYHYFMGDTDVLPFDAHFLLAMVAPRNLYIFSGEDDSCVDYKNEFLAASEASLAYKLYGKKGLLADDKYPVPISKYHDGEIGYHLRFGPHCVSRHDWNALIEYRNKHNV